jgi:hypothetical protein
MAKALITLLPSESKKLIGIGVTQIDWLQEHMKEGKVFVARGTTNAYVLEQMMAIADFDLGCYVAGQVVPKGNRLNACPGKKRLPEVLFIEGRASELPLQEALEVMEKGDIIIKGANALDADGIAGVYLGHPKGGTCGVFWGTLKAKGLRLLIPIGLEKLIAHSVLYSSNEMGIEEIDYSDGMKIGLFPLFGEVFTEIEALETLFDLEVLHVGSGGVGGAEGAVTLLLIGTDKAVKQAFDFCSKLKTIESFKPTLSKEEK